MNTRTSSPLRDPELVAMLAGKPELLAIADALAARPSRSRRRPVVATTIAGIVAAAAAVLMLVSPWQGSGSLVDKALAAVGDQDVLHIVIQRPPSQAELLIDIATGRTIPRNARSEIWFDGERDLKKTITSIDGKTLDEILETREGGWTQGGPIYTCASIAANPIEATKAGVSCNLSGENGTTPRKIPERPPTLEETLAGFLDGYQSALASGRAEQIGSGELDGRDVIWLRIGLPRAVAPLPGAPPPPPVREEVAIDADTHKPLLVRTNGEASFRVLAIETVSYNPILFTKPQLVEGQSGGDISPGTDVTLEQAASILGGKLLWLGPEWQGLQLVETTHHKPTLTVWLGAERRVEHADVIRLTYAAVTADGEVDESAGVKIYEATRCVLNVGMACSPDGLSPDEGQLLLRWPMASPLRLDGRFVSLWPSNPRQPEPAPLDIARALRVR